MEVDGEVEEMKGAGRWSARMAAAMAERQAAMLTIMALAERRRSARRQPCDGLRLRRRLLGPSPSL